MVDWISDLLIRLPAGRGTLDCLSKDTSRVGEVAKISEAHNGDKTKSQAFTKLNEIPKAFMSLLRNPTFLFLNLAGASEGLIISGFAVFLPKQIENQYSVTAVWAALLMGELLIFKIFKELSIIFSRRFNYSSRWWWWNIPRRLSSEEA